MVKVTVAKQSEKEIKFPMLMEGSMGTVVLMTSQHSGNGEGVVVSVPTYTMQHVGKHSDKWFMRKFKPFIGSITLEND